MRAVSLYIDYIGMWYVFVWVFYKWYYPHDSLSVFTIYRLQYPNKWRPTWSMKRFSDVLLRSWLNIHKMCGGYDDLCEYCMREAHAPRHMRSWCLLGKHQVSHVFKGGQVRFINSLQRNDSVQTTYSATRIDVFVRSRFIHPRMLCTFYHGYWRLCSYFWAFSQCLLLDIQGLRPSRRHRVAFAESILPSQSWHELGHRCPRNMIFRPATRMLLSLSSTTTPARLQASFSRFPYRNWLKLNIHPSRALQCRLAHATETFMKQDESHSGRMKVDEKDLLSEDLPQGATKGEAKSTRVWADASSNHTISDNGRLLIHLDKFEENPFQDMRRNKELADSLGNSSGNALPSHHTHSIRLFLATISRYINESNNDRTVSWISLSMAIDNVKPS